MRVSVVAVRRPVKDHLASIYQLYIIIPRITALIAPVVFTGDDLAVWMTLREGEGRSDLALASFLVGHYGAASIFKPSSSVFLSTFFLFFSSHRLSFLSTILSMFGIGNENMTSQLSLMVLRIPRVSLNFSRPCFFTLNQSSSYYLRLSPPAPSLLQPTNA